MKTKVSKVKEKTYTYKKKVSQLSSEAYEVKKQFVNYKILNIYRVVWTNTRYIVTPSQVNHLPILYTPER